MTDDLRSRFEIEALPHLEAVYNVARRLTRRDDEARDLTQEAFLRAYRKFSSFAAGTNCRAWLFTVTYSVFVNDYRRRQREPEPRSIDDAEADAAESAWPFAGATGGRVTSSPARAAAAADVEAALAELSDKFRVAVVLVDVEELSYEDAAAAMNCPVGTLRSRLFRARKRLAERLRSYDIAGRRGR